MASSHMSMGEAHRRITEYLNRFVDVIMYQDGTSLKHLLSLSSESSSFLALADALNLFQDANRVIKQADKFSQYAEIVAPLFRAMQSYRVGHLVESYQAFEKSANAFIQEFRNWESAWALEALYVVVYEIRILAEKADRELASNGKTPEKLKAAGSFLMKVFGVLALGTVHLCRSVIRSIETARIFDFEEFPVRDKVTYMYYTGRLEVLNENFPAYSDIVLAMKRGDLRLLRHALEEHEDRFLRSGVYLVLEKLELQVYQRLVKKIYIIQKQKDPSKAHQIKLEMIVKALKWLEMEMDLDEVECIMSILIYKNLVKGYFAHKSKVAVLSKQDPFPKLNGKPINV
ncbi:hypothetical protein M8C21_005046 [Ambrosia artemisiifolia]|uniref:PCI domain-containing protein n=1 Tax=Ambrosia artemisiifolia TaxID=4212 RepID=A0AAD5D096_AMBAR|nr:hypothetical protein M8C21_005045 [Ambrosia artemisiifolia]KAI7751637.1 hypothetical protein M8C21_005046 [Ambrosia artemisiifolia]